jgi:hypothetical protein
MCIVGMRVVGIRVIVRRAAVDDRAAADDRTASHDGTASGDRAAPNHGSTADARAARSGI